MSEEKATLTFHTKSIFGVEFHRWELVQPDGATTVSSQVSSKNAMLRNCVRILDFQLRTFTISVDADYETVQELLVIINEAFSKESKEVDAPT